MIKFYLILAKTEANGIGYKGDLPWRLKNELNYFSRMTKDVSNSNKINAVIMGRLTWNALPPKWKPLPGRLNIVLSNSAMDLKDAVQCQNFQEAAQLLSDVNNVETAWIIGGAKVYESAISEGFCDRIYLTNIFKDFPCDTFVNINVTNGFKEILDPRVPTEEQEEDGVKYQFKVYEKMQSS